MYRYINFQLDRVPRSVKTVYTNLFAKKNKYKYLRGDVEDDVSLEQSSQVAITTAV